MDADSTIQSIRKVKFTELFTNRKGRPDALIGTGYIFVSLASVIFVIRAFATIIHPPENAAMWMLVVMLASFLVSSVCFALAAKASFSIARSKVIIAKTQIGLDELKDEYVRRYGPLPPDLE